MYICAGREDSPQEGPAHTNFHRWNAVVVTVCWPYELLIRRVGSAPPSGQLFFLSDDI